ncbi:hypothetical protein GOBAR_AA17046 [Gossypium barbadense]|uniref:Uncharacterized protein n=1 Tax=Gossypium barbadense TaxID=3634 RepID=A0A2P5XJX7_GOSBA|nr:hypothetical protein GOBAR_AA17046 [Gossypium barbadense]
MPYSALNIATLIPQWVHAKVHMWCINTSMLNFSTIELCNNLGVDNLCQSSHNNLLMSTSTSYHPNIGGSSSYHSDMGGSSSYHPNISGSSSFHLEQPPISFDMFGNNMYSTSPQATFDPAVDPPDVYNTPQHPPCQ